jgi:hypothetical protein
MRRQSTMILSEQPSRFDVIDDDLAALLRTKSPAEKIEMVAAANCTARLLAAAGARFQHPDWTEDQVQTEVIRRLTGGTE